MWSKKLYSMLLSDYTRSERKDQYHHGELFSLWMQQNIIFHSYSFLLKAVIGHPWYLAQMKTKSLIKSMVSALCFCKLVLCFLFSWNIAFLRENNTQYLLEKWMCFCRSTVEWCSYNKCLHDDFIFRVKFWSSISWTKPFERCKGIDRYLLSHHSWFCYSSYTQRTKEFIHNLQHL